MDISPLVPLAKTSALAHGLDPALVCAVVEQESGWNPWAARFERSWAMKLMSPEGTQLLSGFRLTLQSKDTEIAGRSHSWGLMQTLGQTAREQGCQFPFLSQLCDPEQGLEFGCKILAGKIRIAGGEIVRGLLFYNGGGNINYAAEVMARMKNYQGAA